MELTTTPKTLDCTEVIKIHKRLEQRISNLEQPVLGKKGGVDRDAVLKIIEEEFGKLMDHF